MLRFRAEPTTIAGLLVEQGSRYGDKTAFGFVNGAGEVEAAISYADVAMRAAALADRIREAGGAQRAFLLAFPPGPDFIVSFYATILAGAVPVPVKPPRTADEFQRLALIAMNCQAAAALTVPMGRQLLEGHLPAQGDWPGIPVLADDDAPWPSLAPGAPHETGLALLQYTSGSTSEPKGVRVTEDNLLANCRVIERGFGHTDRSIGVCWLPMFHDMGLIGNVIQPIWVGLTVYHLHPLAVVKRPALWLETISRYGAEDTGGTTSGGPNFAYQLCVDRVREEECEGLDLSHWAVAYTGAEPVRADTVQAFTRRFAPHGFRSRAFYPCYGLAEATLMVTGGKREGGASWITIDGAQLEAGQAVDAADGAPGCRPVVSCGWPNDDHEVVIVHPESGIACHENQVGEIWVTGPSVADGYHANLEATSRTFGASLSDRCDRRYLGTGDLGFVRGGELYVVGRLTDRMIVRGCNVYPEDLEADVLSADPALTGATVAAFAVGEDEDQVVMVIQPRQDLLTGDCLDRVMSAVRSTVSARHGLALTEIVLVDRGQVPRTSSGKVRRRECRRRYQAGELVLLPATTGR